MSESTHELLSEFISVGYRFLEAWQEQADQEVEAYPKYLPSFDEFLAELFEFKEANEPKFVCSMCGKPSPTENLCPGCEAIQNDITRDRDNALVTVTDRKLHIREELKCEECFRTEPPGITRGVLVDDGSVEAPGWLLWLFPSGFSIPDFKTTKSDVAVCSIHQTIPAVKSIRWSV